MLILRTGSIKGCGNAKVVKTLVVMTTVLSAEWSVIQKFLHGLAQAVTAFLLAGVELSGGKSGFSQVTCFVPLGRKSLPLRLSFLALETAALRL